MVFTYPPGKLCRLICIVGAFSIAPWQPRAANTSGFHMTDEVRTSLDLISSRHLRGRLSFLASDLLEGRQTGSRGLDIAAEYIASEFRQIGLEPAGDDGYFQTAEMRVVEHNLDGFRLSVATPTGTVEIGSDEVTVENPAGRDLDDRELIKLEANAGSPEPESMAGKAVLIDAAAAGGGRLLSRLGRMQPSLAIVLLPHGGPTNIVRRPQVFDPKVETAQGPPVIYVRSRRLTETVRQARPEAGLKVSLHMAAPAGRIARLHNVAGRLRGADPGLRDTCVLVTAHYDHLGVQRSNGGSAVYNGANDDGSGTVSVIEIAGALSRAPQTIKRSILFVAYFGEEEGLQGSRYYSGHPICPVSRTVAQISLEQLGRTDSSEGSRVNTVVFTGAAYSDLPEIFRQAGGLTGIQLGEDPHSDAYFGRGDNQPLADQGVPSHTVSVAFDFPDYHQPGDRWDKLDYENLARVDRMLALGVLILSTSDREPRWNGANPGSAAFLQAWNRWHNPH